MNNLILTSIIFLLFSCSKQKVTNVAQQDEVIKDIVLNATVSFDRTKRGYMIQGNSDNCYSRWIFNKGVLELESFQCMASLSASQKMLDSMLDRLVRNLKDPLDIKKIKFNVRNFTDIEKRIALHAYKSSEWDDNTGRPKSNIPSEKFVKEYASSTNAYIEVTSLMSRKCYDIKLVKVTDVSAFRASSLPYYTWLRNEQVKRKSFVPVNYNMEFDVFQKHSNCFE